MSSAADAAELARFTQAALTVAREAAALILQGFRSGPSVQRKSGYADLVTEYDLASERLIRTRLAELTPGVAIVGEEQGGSAGDEPTWYCDPIDGTTNFAHGHPFFCVSLGLMQGPRPLAGAVVAPALQLEWRGFVGGGAFRNDRPCSVSARDTLAEAVVATGFSPHGRRRGHPENNQAAFERIGPMVRAVRCCGSAALDLCLVADGTYEAYWERHLGTWDVAAGAALVLAAGGKLSNLLGEEAADLRGGYIIASNRRVHAALVEQVSREGTPQR